VFLLFLSEFVRASLLVSLVPALVMTKFGLPLDVAAAAISAHYLTDTLGRSPSGWLVDRLGSGSVLAGGLSVAAFALLLIATARPSSPLWVYLGLYGVGTSPLWPSVITTTTGGIDEGRGRIIGGIFALWLLAIGLGPMVMNWVLPDHVREGLVAMLVVQVLAVLAARALPDRKSRPEARARPPRLLSRIAEIKVLFPGMFAQAMTVGILLPVINTFLRHTLGLTGVRYGELLLVGGGLAVLLMVPIGRLADRAGVRAPLVLGFVSAGVGILALGAVREFVWAILLAGFIGVAYALILPAWNALLASTVDRRAAGSLWGVFMTVEGAGLALGPLVGARAWDLVRPIGPFLVSGMILLAMSLFYALYPIERLQAERVR